MTADRDDDLRARFDALRVADGRRTPAFDLPDPARSRGRALAWSGGALAIAAVVALSFSWRGTQPTDTVTGSPEVMLRVAAEMPSDFLLDDESSDVRRDVPRFATETNDEVPFL